MYLAGLSFHMLLNTARIMMHAERLVGALTLPQEVNLQSQAKRVEDDRAAIREQDKPRPALNLEVQLSLFFDAWSPGSFHGSVGCESPGWAACCICTSSRAAA